MCIQWLQDVNVRQISERQENTDQGRNVEFACDKDFVGVFVVNQSLNSLNQINDLRQVATLHSLLNLDQDSACVDGSRSHWLPHHIA